MSQGPVSRDGKHQWDGEQWVSLPAPPRSRMDRAHSAFQIVLVVAVVIVGLAILVLSLS